MAQVVVPLPPQLLVLLPLVAKPLKRRSPRRRKRVRPFIPAECFGRLLTTIIEKEESDEDMGFGLFD